MTAFVIRAAIAVAAFLGLMAAATASGEQGITSAAAPTADDSTFMVRMDDLTWKDAPGYPAGVKSAIVYAGSGVGVSYLKLPAGTRVMPHTHPGDHWATVLSGTCAFGFGTDMDAGTVLGPGDFCFVPAGAVHWYAAEADLLIAGSAMGEPGMTYANPADDPRGGSPIR